jgi:predicted nucleic acid-binding Zn ribbon protein
MPVYTYRREDGSTFDIRQKFSDDPLTVDPQTGQSVVRVVQPTMVVFKGSGFYVNDSKGASNSSLKSSKTSSEKSESAPAETTPAKESKPEATPAAAD